MEIASPGESVARFEKARFLRPARPGWQLILGGAALPSHSSAADGLLVEVNAIPAAVQMELEISKENQLLD
ncbi:MAG: hypothetical protein WCA92_19305, partial [Terriglobales bacterium]